MTRRGYTLIELLVVIGVMGVLIGLLMSAVQAARDAAARAACANNMKQLALAAHMYHDTHDSFPPASDPGNNEPGWKRGENFNWPTRLLPHLDQQPLWEKAVAAFQVEGNSNRNPPHIGLTTVVKVFTCPADGRLSAPLSDDRNYRAAYGSYEGVGCGRGVSRGLDGAIRHPNGVRMAEVTDGTSSTLMFGEKPPWGRYLSGTWYPSASDDPTFIYDPDWNGGQISTMCVYSDGVLNNGCRGPFRFGPGRLTNRCDAWHFWSVHRGGGNFALCDGSVRFLPYSAEPIMVALATRAGGEVVQLPD